MAKSLKDVKKGDKVYIKTFTGMRLGEFEVIASNNKLLKVAKRDGTQMTFDKVTGKQTDAKTDKYANSVSVDKADDKIEAPKKEKAVKEPKAEKATKETKAKDEKPAKAEKPAKGKKKTQEEEVAEVPAADDFEDEDFEDELEDEDDEFDEE